MYQRTPLPPALEQLLRHQHGAITLRQARTCGLSHQQFRRIRRHWTQLSRALYVAGEVTWLAFAWACLLRAGDGAALGGSAACHVHGVVTRAPQQITVLTPLQKVALEHGPLRARFRRVPCRPIGEPPRSRLEDALLEHASEASRFDLIEAVTRALAERRTTPERLRRSLAARARQAQRALLMELIAHSEDGIHSVLEWQFHVAVATPHRLAGLRRQVRINGKGRVDVLFEEYALVVELDGREFHDAERDARRDNEHALRAGLTTLRFTWRQVIHEACEVARVVDEALRVRGWRGSITVCGACTPRGQHTV